MAKRELTDPETWFERAGYFHYSALILLGNDNPSQALAYPAITLKAFATEAYFKCLIILEGSGRPSEIHDLVVLYERLSPSTRKQIRREWDVHTRPALLKARQSAPPDIVVPTTLQKALEQSRNAFIDWRYHVKGDTLGFTIGMVPTLARKRILELKPEWKPAPPNLLCELDPEAHFAKAKNEQVRGGFVTTILDGQPAGHAFHFRRVPDLKDGDPR